MIVRKFARFAAAPDRVRALFAEVERWPEWFPGILSLEVLEGTAGRRLVELRQDFMGQEWRQRLDHELVAGGFDQRQVAGRLKRWDSRWRFLAPPDGEGTTLSLELDVDLGLMGTFVPARMVQETVDRLFAAAVRAAREELGAQQAAAWSTREIRLSERLLALHETPQGLELWFEGRRYRLEPLD